ncbi:MAG: hypothetical protein V1821_01050 [bacterium]
MFLLEWLQGINNYLIGIVNEMPEHSATPVDAAVFLFFKGGWIPVVVMALSAFKHLWVEYKEDRWEHRQKYVLLAVDVPRSNEQSPKAMENVFAMVYGGKAGIDWIERYIQGKDWNKFSFEIVSNEGNIKFYIRTRAKMRDLIEAAIYSQYPNAEIQEVEDYVKTTLPTKWPNKEYFMGGGELVLKNDQIFPIKTFPYFEHTLSGELKDPIAGVIEAMNKIGPNEHFWFQICCRPADDDWKIASEKMISKLAGNELKDDRKKSVLQLILEFPFKIAAEIIAGIFGVTFGDAQIKEEKKPVLKLTYEPNIKEKMEALANKASKLGFKCKIRMIYAAKKEVARVGDRIRMMNAALSGFNSQNLNAFRKHKPSAILTDYPWQTQIWSYYLSLFMYTPSPVRAFFLYHRYKGRSIPTMATPYILCTEELASIWHFPTLEIKSPLLRKVESKRSEAPFNVPFREEIKLPQKAAPEFKGEVRKEGPRPIPAIPEIPDNLPFS